MYFHQIPNPVLTFNFTNKSISDYHRILFIEIQLSF